MAGAPPLPPGDNYGADTQVTPWGVVVENPSQWWPKTKSLHDNFHAIDVHFWYWNIRENVKERLDSWFDKNDKK